MQTFVRADGSFIYGELENTGEVKLYAPEGFLFEGTQQYIICTDRHAAAAYLLVDTLEKIVEKEPKL